MICQGMSSCLWKSNEVGSCKISTLIFEPSSEALYSSLLYKTCQPWKDTTRLDLHHHDVLYILTVIVFQWETATRKCCSHLYICASFLVLIIRLFRIFASEYCIHALFGISFSSLCTIGGQVDNHPSTSFPELPSEVRNQFLA